MFAKWKLRDRIFLGYSVPGIVFAIFSATIFVNSYKTTGIFKDVNYAQNVLIESYESVVSISMMGRQVRGYLLVKNSDGALDKYEKERQRFINSTARLEQLIKDQGQKAKIQQISQLGEQFQDLSTRTFRMVDDGKQQEAVVIFLRESKQIVDEIDRLNQQFKQTQEEFITSQVERTTKTLELLEIASIVIPIFGLAVIIWFALLITKQISGAGGLVDQVQDSGIKVTTSATEITASSKQLEAMLTEQLASTNEVVAAAKEIAATSRELVKTIEDVAAKSVATTYAATDSQKSLTHMEATMSQLASATSSISGRLETITEKANKINGIVVTITKVADQTNLLSLNASIEAEKAGEYGAGFSVVAREIRRLADQSAVATLDIEQMIKEMQSAVASGVMEMDKFTKEMVSGVQDVRNISTQIVDIIEKVQSLTPRFQMVSEGMEAQSEAAGQISESMSQLSQASGETTSSVRELKGVIERLNGAAISLQKATHGLK
ncbi:HAMP domain-containing methyl-accepting chemotaxis protein [Aerosakkonema funiforme]|uniref:HAMP domain-containing methyl-accepting chemotaxis protein n=1 Tax=Aerosakkonema funiforme TaxID=1246630 RepID=UPI0035BA378B